MKSFIFRIWKIYKPFRKAFVVSLLLLALSQSLILISPYIFGSIIDSIIEQVVFKRILMLSCLWFIVFIIDSVILHYFREYYELKNLDFETYRHISNETIKRMTEFSVGQHRNENSGLKTSIITKGQNDLSNLVQMIMYDVAPMILRIVFTIIALFYLSFPLGGIVFIGMAIFIFSVIYTNIEMAPRMKQINDLGHRNYKIRSEMVCNMGIVKTNAQEEYSVRECDNFYKKICDLGKKVWIKYHLTVAGRNIIAGITRVLVLIVGAYYVYQHVYTAGQLVIFLSWSGNVFGGMNNIGFIQRKCLELYASVKKYFTMFDIDPDIKTVPNSVRPEKFDGKIEFKNVSFQYSSRKYVEDKNDFEPLKKSDLNAISDVSFIIEPGQKVAFVGHSGAGKTTIIQLLIRAYDPDCGKIIIDGNNLKALHLKHFMRNIGIVEQGVTLFDNTIKYNILFGLNGRRDKVTEDDLKKIAELSCIDKFYDRLEDGFDTIIGEKGIKLSGGECQRVGIARALIKYPKFMIFDEATSQLDSENEEAIHQAINEVSKGRTTIIIAHRLSTVKNADKIFVMDKGKIVGEGSHDELMLSCETYKNLVTRQLVTI